MFSKISKCPVRTVKNRRESCKIQPATYLHSITQVLYQSYIVRHSVTVVLCINAQYTKKGCCLFKYCNAIAGYHGNALWVSLSAPMDCVVPFGNRMTISCKTSLAMHTDTLNELGNIKLIGYYHHEKTLLRQQSDGSTYCAGYARTCADTGTTF